MSAHCQRAVGVHSMRSTQLEMKRRVAFCEDVFLALKMDAAALALINQLDEDGFPIEEDSLEIEFEGELLS